MCANRYFIDKRGTAAIEFALVAPVFLLLLFGIVAFGMLFATYNAVQQLAAEAARSSIAGLSNTERDQLARAYVTANVRAYGLINPANVSVTTTAQPTSYQVNVSYDASGSFIFKLGQALAGATPVIRRSATVSYGGF